MLKEKENYLLKISYWRRDTEIMSEQKKDTEEAEERMRMAWKKQEINFLLNLLCCWQIIRLILSLTMGIRKPQN